MAHDVFISHSAKDKPTADAMCAMLEATGLRCWVAPRDVLPGMKWAQAILAGIRESRAFVLVFSKDSNRSPQVLNEVDQAVKGEIPIIPFRLDETPLSDDLEYYVSRSHWLNAFTPPLEAHLRKLRDALGALLGHPAPSAPPLPPPVAVAAPTRRHRAIGAVAGLVLVTGALGVYAATRGTGSAAERLPPLGSGATPQPAPGPQAEPWQVPLGLARAAAKSQDWETAAKRLADAEALGVPGVSIPTSLAEGVARYAEDPVVDSIAPPDGTVVAGPELHLTGRLRSGRATDAVEVNGKPARLTEGRFEVVLQIPAEEVLGVVIRVVDGETERGAPLRLTYRHPVAAVWRAALDGAISAAREEDWQTAAKWLADAKTLGAPAVELPATLTDGVAAYVVEPVLEVTEPLEGESVEVGRNVAVKGRMTSGRKGDRVVVSPAGDLALTSGGFETVAKFEHAGLGVLVVEVKDVGGAVRTRIERRVIVVERSMVVPAWAKVSVGQEKDAARLGIPAAYENRLGMRFVWVPAGEFEMGSPESEAQTGRGEDEILHRVRITKGFYMGVTEVTNGEYRRFKEGYRSGWFGGSTMMNDDRQPVVEITYDDAVACAEWLGTQDRGREYRLATEAEWEYACRAGTRGRRYWGEDDGEVFRYANVYDAVTKAEDDKRGKVLQRQGAFPKDDGYRLTARVGSYPPNAWGLYDMLGNVQEWVSDWYGEYPNASAVDPAGPSVGELRVLRGGSWWDDIWHVRAAGRNGTPPFMSKDRIGFRVVLAPPRGG